MPLLTEIAWSEVPTMLFFTGLFDGASQLMATLRPSVGGAKGRQSAKKHRVLARMARIETNSTKLEVGTRPEP
jgi:hypothetical protein